MPEFNHDLNFTPFELDYVFARFSTNHQTFRDLAGIARALQARKRNLAGHCWRMDFTTSGVAIALALGKRFRTVPMPNGHHGRG